MSEVILTAENFDEEVLKCGKPVLVDFWASWCAPCMMLAPTMAELAEEYPDAVKVCKVNVDEQPELAGRFYIDAIPAVLLFKNGELTDKLIGLHSKGDYTALL